jgi:hypothetical protein
VAAEIELIIWLNEEDVMIALPNAWCGIRATASISP